MTHTPGPWTSEGRVVYQVDGFGLAYCEGNNAEANATFIAAGPDMLAALMEVDDGWTVKGERMIEAAIAKAKGEL